AEEINRFFVPPSNDSAAIQAWAKDHLTLHLQRVLFAAHACLDEWGIHGHPDWVNEPFDSRWWFRVNDHLSHLLNFLRQQAAKHNSPTEGGKEKRGAAATPTDADNEQAGGQANKERAQEEGAKVGSSGDGQDKPTPDELGRWLPVRQAA